jgi:hypothetical protein
LPSIFDKNNPDGVYPALEKLETRLGLPKGFCEALVKEDDWSFIVKLHALLEAALTALLTAKLAPELRPIFARLEMSRSDTGKIAFAKALGLISPEDYRLIHTLSELRNDLVHSVDMIGFNLTAYVAGLDSSKLNSFVKTFALLPKQSSRDAFESGRNYALQYPKSFVWEAGVGFLCGLISLQIYSAELDKEMAESRRKLADASTVLFDLFRQAQSQGEAPPEEKPQ